MSFNSPASSGVPREGDVTTDIPQWKQNILDKDSRLKKLADNPVEKQVILQILRPDNCCN